MLIPYKIGSGSSFWKCQKLDCGSEIILPTWDWSSVVAKHNNVIEHPVNLWRNISP